MKVIKIKKILVLFINIQFLAMVAVHPKAKKRIKFNTCTPVIISSYKFDNSIFTQGLEIDKQSQEEVFLSSGLYKKSFIGKYNFKERRLLKKNLDKNVFAEGLTVVNDKIWLLTWQENKVLVLSKKKLKLIRTLKYSDVGWGIANDKKKFYVSNGTSNISIRNINDFHEERKLKVLDNSKKPVEKLNELEYANGYIYANKWHSKNIYKININTGYVTKKFDCSKIIAKEKKKNKESVINGIAHLSGNEFLITGKNWAHLYKVILK